MRITIDPGHVDKYNQYPPIPEYNEGMQMWKLSQYLRYELIKKGVDVVNTRPKATDNPTLSERGSIAVKNGSTMFLSLHSNAAPDAKNTEPTGSLIFYSTKGKQYKDLADRLVSRVSEVMGHYSRGSQIKLSGDSAENDYYGVIRAAANGGCTCAMLMEHGFHTNPKDALFLSDDNNLKKLAEAEAEVIFGYFKGCAADSTGNPTLRKGNKGEDVKRLQGLLNSTGMYPTLLIADGDFGAKTDEAVRIFQMVAGLAVDGICGAKTWAALLDYTSEKEADTANQETAAFIGLSKTEAATKILEMVKPNALSVGLFPSVKAAQMILESGYLTTELARNANNCFGMKNILSGNSWQGSTWDGVSVYRKDTQEQKPDSTAYTIPADFRKYTSIADSIADHSAYLLGAMNGNKLRYEGITKAKDYREQITIIKNGDYATDVDYVDKVCGVVEKFGLDRYDKEAGVLTEVNTAIDVLMEHGVITGREYWLNSVKSGIIEYLGQLLINMAGKLQEI